MTRLRAQLDRRDAVLDARLHSLEAKLDALLSNRGVRRSYVCE